MEKLKENYSYKIYYSVCLGASKVQRNEDHTEITKGFSKFI
jgi:hypothetical protein